MTWIVQRDGNETSVPNTESLKGWAKRGGVKPSDLVFHPVLQRWMYAQDVLELRDCLIDDSASDSDSQRGQRDYIVRQNQQEFRAPDVATLREWADEGRLLPNADVFDPTLNRWLAAGSMDGLQGVYGKRAINVRALARHYRQLVGIVGLQLLISPLFLSDTLALLVLPATIATSIALTYCAYRTAEALGSPSAALWAVAMFVPCVNIFTLLALSSNATAACRAAGIKVGFLGPEV
jgi:hypothetical protein